MAGAHCRALALALALAALPISSLAAHRGLAAADARYVASLDNASSINATQPRPNARPHPSGLTFALLMPCTPGHFKHFLPRTLMAYAASAVHPVEVIVSVSGSSTPSDALAPRRLDEVRARFSSIFSRFVLVAHRSPKSSGANRNLAAAHATSEICIFGDADDLPHPQRVTVLAHFFARMPKVDMVHHTWCDSRAAFESWTAAKLSTVRVVTPSELSRTFDVRVRQRYSPAAAARMIARTDRSALVPELLTLMPVYQPLRTAKPIHTGNLAIRRRVLEAVRWPDKHGGEDKTFSWSVVAQFGSAIVIEVPLICYCKSSSAKCKSACSPATTLASATSTGTMMPSNDIGWPVVGRRRRL